MASKYAVGTAAFLHIVLRISFFIEQRSDLCSTAPTLASWLFLISFLDILLDMCIYPVRYMHLPFICQIIAETLVTILLTEFGTLVVWCNVEKVSCKLCKSLLLLIGMPTYTYYAWEAYILGTVTTSISLTILYFVAQATDHYHFLRKRSMRTSRRVINYLSHTYTKIKSMLFSKMRKRAANNLANCNYIRDADEIEMDTDVIYRPQRCKNKRSRSRNRARSRCRK